MKYIYTILVVFFLITNVKAEETSTTSFSLSIAQDPVFGFYPSFYGSFGLSDNMQFTLYGVLYTQDALGYSDGTNLLTEIGCGLNFSMLEGALNINPQLGIGNGNYQSGGGRPVVADNIVPSIGVYYTKESFSAALNFIYWKGFRKEAKEQPYIDMMQILFQPSINISKNVAIGIYFDNLMLKAETDDDKGKLETYYFWLGPSFKFNFNKGVNVVFTGGIDLVDYFKTMPDGREEVLKDYYKMVLNLPF